MKDKGSEVSIPVLLTSIQSDLYVVQRVANCYSIASVGIFPRFAYPHVPETAYGALGFLDCLHLRVICEKPFPLRVFCTLLNMKSVRNDIKGVLALELGKTLDIVE